MEKGKRVGATEVHHIIPVEPALSEADKEALMFDPANLRCLCKDCHHEAHRKLRVYDKETVQARQRQRLEAVLNTFFPGVKLNRIPGG